MDIDQRHHTKSMKWTKRTAFQLKEISRQTRNKTKAAPILTAVQEQLNQNQMKETTVKVLGEFRSFSALDSA